MTCPAQIPKTVKHPAWDHAAEQRVAPDARWCNRKRSLVNAIVSQLTRNDPDRQLSFGQRVRMLTAPAQEPGFG